MSTSDEGLDIWILKRRHEELSEMFRAAWDNYIKFYTVFLTFNLGAMGWLVTHDKGSPLPTNLKHIVAIVFIIQTFLCAVTSIFMAVYSRKVGRDQVRTEDALLCNLETAQTMNRMESIPIILGSWAGIANGLAMMVMIVAWYWVGFQS